MAPRIAELMRDKDLTPEELQEFYDTYNGMFESPFITNALAQTLTPTELTEFIFRAGAVPVESDTTRDAVLHQIGSVFVLAAGGVNRFSGTVSLQEAFDTVAAGLAMEDGSSLAVQQSRFVEGMKEAGRRVYAPYELSPYAGTQGEILGYSFISQVVGEAGKANPDLALGAEFF